MGSNFALGPGGKGSNQAVAAARAGAQVKMACKLGDDPFGQLARKTWADAGIDASLTRSCDTATGAAAILIDGAHGENAIIVVPGACFTITADELDAMTDAIRSAHIFLAQLEMPVEIVERGMKIAREAGVTTILNPAPAPPAPLPDSMLSLADYVVPNETEAAILTGLPVETIEQAERAAAALQQRGAKNVILTLGVRGALVRHRGRQLDDRRLVQCRSGARDHRSRRRILRGLCRGARRRYAAAWRSTLRLRGRWDLRHAPRHSTLNAQAWGDRCVARASKRQRNITITTVTIRLLQNQEPRVRA